MFTKACNEFEKVVKDLELDERVERLQIIEEKGKWDLACEESWLPTTWKKERVDNLIVKEIPSATDLFAASQVPKNKKHNILLCRSMQWKTELTEKNSASENKPVVVSAERDQVLASFCNKPSVALQTLKVIRGNGKRRTARAIIDSAHSDHIY
ncbi:hypothetical protein JTE90_025029 [Oedothorax gibbosus]|uniref:Uncharacterized protein n=1 Tax=Oedothorax gibbosus TaxID=931172 RepID=A0AAV6TWM8_9ARAC|nr:hypothetical protein JTE90_025029 [Oedothorax gibbosus]